jgi:dTDP-4-dehydrorhamnose reductase
MLAAVPREQKVVVFGGSGFVGSRVLALWRDEHDVLAPTHAEVDVLDENAVAAFLMECDAPVVLNLAAGAHVDAAEAERGSRSGRVYALNAEFPGRLAALCEALGKYLLHISTDYVFDGTQAERKYREQDPPHPLSWYGETKLAGERLVLERHPSACIARIEMPFSGRPHSRSDFARTCLRRLEAGDTIVGVTDQRITPVFLDHAVKALRVVHIAATDWTTPYRYARSIAERRGLDTALVLPARFEEFAATRPAPRPQHSWLDVSHFVTLFGHDILRPVEDALDEWVQQLQSAASRA